MVPRCDLEIRRRFFDLRVTQRRSALSEHTVTQLSFSSFKRELDTELGELLYTVLKRFKFQYSCVFVIIGGVSIGENWAHCLKRRPVPSPPIFNIYSFSLFIIFTISLCVANFCAYLVVLFCMVAYWMCISARCYRSM